MLSTRILITTYHNAFLVPAGGEFELISIADSLKKLGVIADIYGPYCRSVEHYDVALHFSVHPAGLDLVRAIRAAGKPVVLWPNFWVTDTLPQASVVEEFISLSNHIVFKSQVEKEHFCNLFPLPEEKCNIVLAGVDPIFSKPAPPDLFRSLYGIKGEYALCLGIIEPVKNQLAAIRATKQMGIPLVVVGRYRDLEYYVTCRKEASHNTLFIESLPFKSEIVRSALQECNFYIELSNEPPGLSAISAYMAGCRLVLGDSAWAHEHFSNNAIYVDAESTDSICTGIQEAIAHPTETRRREKFIKRHALPAAIMPLQEILSMSAAKK